MMDDIELLRVPRHGNVVRVMVRSYKGSQPYLDVREWFGADELKPGKGATLPLEAIEPLQQCLTGFLRRERPGARTKARKHDVSQ
jgi:hypothetical protein